MSGLPYDRTPSPQPESEAHVAEAALTEPSALDMALDDYVPAGQPVPDHVQSLMGRMSKGKVYLLDESPAIVLVDGKDRIRGDPVSLTAILRLVEADHSASPTSLPSWTSTTPPSGCVSTPMIHIL